MPFADSIPLAKSGATVRNIVVVLLYLVLLPLLLVALPFWLLFAVGTNRHGLGDRVANSPLGAVPGVSGGGWTAGIVVFVISLVVLGGVGAVLPGDDGGTTPDAQASGEMTTSDPAASDDSTDTETAAEEETTAEDTTTETATTDTATATATETTEETQTETATTAAPTTTETAQVEEPDPQSFEGSGSSVESGIDVEGGLVVVDFTHDGESNFQTKLIRNGQDEKFLTNAIGQYDGRVAFYAPEGEYQLDIEADGEWTATVRQPRFTEADVDSASGVTAEGAQHDWIGPLRFEGGEVVHVQAAGDGNLAVWLADHQGAKVDLLANDIAPYESETVVTESGAGLLLIETDSAEWRIEIRDE